jgi:hypothetical protein
MAPVAARRGADRPPAIIHLFGFPGTGKLTVATALAEVAARRDERVVVVDNHHTSNVVLSVLPVDGIAPVPPAAWDLVGEIREVLLRAIRDLSPPDWSFVFTNVLIEGNPSHARVPDQLAALAEARGSRYVPVRLRCDDDELLRRVVHPDRHGTHKWIDGEAVAAFVDSQELLHLDHPLLLDLDITCTTPETAATRILDHLGSLA